MPIETSIVEYLPNQYNSADAVIIRVEDAITRYCRMRHPAFIFAEAFAHKHSIYLLIRASMTKKRHAEGQAASRLSKTSGYT